MHGILSKKREIDVKNILISWSWIVSTEFMTHKLVRAISVQFYNNMLLIVPFFYIMATKFLIELALYEWIG